MVKTAGKGTKPGQGRNTSTNRALQWNARVLNPTLFSEQLNQILFSWCFTDAVVPSTVRVEAGPVSPEPG